MIYCAHAQSNIPLRCGNGRRAVGLIALYCRGRLTLIGVVRPARTSICAV